MSAIIDDEYNAFLKEQGCWSCTIGGYRWKEDGSNEDRKSIFGNSFGVYDGHCGDEVSEFTSQNFAEGLQQIFRLGITDIEKLKKVISDYCIEFNEKIKKHFIDGQIKIKKKTIQFKVVYDGLHDEKQTFVGKLFDKGLTFHRSYSCFNIDNLDDIDRVILKIYFPTLYYDEDFDTMIDLFFQGSYIMDKHDDDFEPTNGGSTLCQVIKHEIEGKRYILCINLGDSQATLKTRKVKGKFINIPLSQAHNTKSEAERKRIEALGGKIVQGSQTMRVNGDLTVTRALGNFNIKNENGDGLYKIDPDIKVIEINELGQVISDDLPEGTVDDLGQVISDDIPEGTVDDLEKDKVLHKFIVICSDGISDHFTMLQIHTIVSNAIDKGEDPAKALCEESRNNKGQDDVTAIVVLL
jgi:serine/threonine protein phosphatase PrpC